MALAVAADKSANERTSMAAPLTTEISSFLTLPVSLAGVAACTLTASMNIQVINITLLTIGPPRNYA
jgi:hypothetical protein